MLRVLPHEGKTKPARKGLGKSTVKVKNGSARGDTMDNSVGL